MASCVTESPLTGLGRRRLHARPRRRGASLLDFFVAAPGADGISAARSWCRSGRLHRGVVAGVSRRRGLRAACPGRRRGSRRAARALRHRCRSPSSPAPAAALARDGRARSTPSRRTSSRSSRRSSPISRRPLRSTRPGATCFARATCSGSPSSATRSSGSGRKAPSPFYRGEIAAAISEWVVERGGTLGTRRPGGVRADPARAGPRSLRRTRGAHEPAAVVGRDPDRLRAGAARARRRPPRSRSEIVAVMEARPGESAPREFLAGLDEEGSRAGSSPPTGSARPLTSPRSTATGLCASGHLLERQRLGRDRPGHRHPPQQHARRAGPQPTRLPPPRRPVGGCRR